MLARSESAPLRVNVGCGQTTTVGWVNIDNSISVRLSALPWLWPLVPSNQRKFAAAAKSAGIRLGSATRLPLADGSAEVVYSSHMMEHLDRREAVAFLAEARRVLRSGGTIRLVLPDISRHAREYLDHGDADVFIDRIHMGASRPRTLYEWAKHIIYGPRHHLWMYDGPSLCRLLAANGFAETRVLPPGETTLSNAGPLDLRERDSESVYVEAIKP